MSQNVNAKSKVGIKLHTGSILVNQIAKTYPTVLDALKEGIQNGIDRNAQRIEVFIDTHRKTYYIMNDGDGAGEEEFNTALSQIGKTLKDPKAGKYGRFGLGLVAHLGKCSEMIFESCVDGKKYRRWTMKTEEIENSSEPTASCVEVGSWYHSPRLSGTDAKAQWWVSRVTGVNYTQDKIQGFIDLKKLAQDIEDAFGVQISNRQINIKLMHQKSLSEKATEVKVSKTLFKGTPISAYENADVPETGKVTLRLFKSHNPTRGKVLFGDNTDNRIPIASLRKFSFHEFVSREISDALSSGFFEGEILGEKLMMHSGRKKFEEDEALIGLGLVLSVWWEYKGKKLFENFSSDKSSERYASIGITSLQTFEKILHSSPNILSALKALSVGFVGVGNADFGKKSSMTTFGTSTKGPPGKEKSEAGGVGKNEPAKERSESITSSVSSPDGKERKLVKAGGAISILHNMDPVFADLWKWQEGSSTIEINTSHDVWAYCERVDSDLAKLHLHILTQAIQHVTLSKEIRSELALTYDMMNKAFTESLSIGRPGTKKAK